jgi:epoxyqueuosine reductase
MHTAALTAALKEESQRLGFDLAGATPAVASPDFDRLRQWLADGHAGQMHYVANRLDAYRHPGRVLEGAKSILMLGVNYRSVEPVEPGPGQVSVSRYAWGDDYHQVIRDRLHKLADFHRQLVPASGVRGVVDTAPLLERQFGQLAGLGWIGRNAMLINERFGSWFFLAALLTTEELAYDQPAASRCGACRACLDVCPTGALVEPFRMDARKCISYLTIELRDPIPTELHAACGRRLFGCDACQDACPWNRNTPATTDPAFLPGSGMNPVDLAELTALDEDAFRQRFRHTPLWRAKREGILRNACNITEGGQKREA